MAAAQCTGIVCGFKKLLLGGGALIGIGMVTANKNGVTITEPMKFWPVLAALVVIGLTIYDNKKDILIMQDHYDQHVLDVSDKFAEAEKDYEKHKRAEEKKFDEAKAEFYLYKDERKDAAREDWVRREKIHADLDKRFMTQIEGRDFKIDSNFLKLQKGGRFTSDDGKELEKKIDILQARLTRYFEKVDKLTEAQK